MILTYSNIGFKLLYENVRLRNISDLDFAPSRSLKVKCQGAIRLAIYGFLLLFHSNMGPNRYLRDMRLRNLSDLSCWPSEVAQGRV